MNFGNFDYSDWQKMPNPAEGYQNPHRAAFGGILRALDPMTYIPGIKEVANPVHDAGEQLVTGVNTVLSPVIGAAQKVTETITPGLKQFQDAVPITKDIDRFVRDKPFDAAALAAATFFSGGAATPALTGTASAGSLGAAGAGAATSAITPALASTGAATTGAGALGAAGTAAGQAALTPAFASGLGATTAAAPGILGATGTAALNAAIPSTYGALSSSIPSASLLNTFKTNIKPLKAKLSRANDYYSNFKNFAQPDQNEIRRKQIEDQLMQNITGVNNGY